MYNQAVIDNTLTELNNGKHLFAKAGCVLRGYIYFCTFAAILAAHFSRILNVHAAMTKLSGTHRECNKLKIQNTENL